MVPRDRHESAGAISEETRELHWGDLHGTGDAVTLTVHGKGDKYADVHVPHDVDEVLRSWSEVLAIAVGHVPGPGAPIFPALGGAHRYVKERMLPLSVFSVGAIVRRRMIDAGFDGPRYGAHALRATAATVAHENGADLRRSPDCFGTRTPKQPSATSRPPRIAGHLRLKRGEVLCSPWCCKGSATGRLHPGGLLTKHLPARTVRLG